MTSSQRWVVVEETFCADGNSDAAVREFNLAHREYTAEPDRLRIEVMCHRDTGASTVRFSWNEIAPARAPRKKPRHAG